MNLDYSALPAPAKLNLFLHVLGRRADGYHELQSVFTLIDWADQLALEALPGPALERVDLGARLPPDDLCLRAARLLQDSAIAEGHALSRLGARLVLRKNLPWGAGLGGGSSDAATVLIGLNCFWRLHWPRGRLLALAARLGADVPFFVGGRNAWVEGIGERLQPVTLAPRTLAVLKPAASLPTAAIFSAPELVRDTPPVILADFLAHERNEQQDQSRRGSSSPFFGHNDLQPVAVSVCPEVGLALERLRQDFGHARMTGSGSAVFALAGWDGALQPWPAVGALPEAWVGRLCRTLPEHPLIDWCA